MEMNIRRFEEAAERISKVIHATPLSYSSTFSEISGANIYLKCENLQKTGSFKVRGAYNKISKMAEEGPLPALIASSAGNHAQGVAYAATASGGKATIVMPEAAPIAKVSATAGYGAEVVLHGTCYDDAYERAMQIKAERNAVFVHPFDDADVIAGQGTIALEILKTLPTVNTVLVPAGGGGLLSGIATCIKSINPSIRVVGVQSENANAIVQSFAAKKLVATDSSATIADGIAVRKPGEMTTSLIYKYVDDVVTVSEAQIAEAILMLIERAKLVVEPAGAVSLAAALNHKKNIKGENVVCLLSGGNMDVGLIHKIIEKGLATRGRLLKFNTILRDIPGRLCHCTGLMGEEGANVLAIQHDRTSAGLNIGDALLQVTCEVSGKEHGARLLNRLKQNGYIVTIEE